MNSYPDFRSLSSVSGGIVLLGNEVKPTFILDGQPVEVPSRADLLAYVSFVERMYRRWADQPDEPQPALFDAALPLGQGPDSYAETQALLLPLRVSEYRQEEVVGGQAPEELIAAVLSAQRTILVGEPGSGKSSALERLAWLLALGTLQDAAAGTGAAGGSNTAPVVPLLVSLAEYRGEADLLPLVQQALNRAGAFAINPTSVRLLLHAADVRFVLLLDGLNEFGRYAEDGRIAIRRTLANYPGLCVHATCRSADFDRSKESNAATAWLPGAQHWLLQPLADNIYGWDDPDGDSDVRAYLRRHLGSERGRRLWQRLHADERLASMARNPLLLFMLKEVGGDQGGDLPADRGALLRGFVRSSRLLGAIDDLWQRDAAERALEMLGWELQTRRTLKCSLETAGDVLRAAVGGEFKPIYDQLMRCRLLLREGNQHQLLHQLLQEYAAAAYLLRQPRAPEQVAALAEDEWWRETAILALWLDPRLQEEPYLYGLMRTPAVDLRVRVVAANILGMRGPLAWLAQKAAGYIDPPMVRIEGGVAQIGGADPEAYEDGLPSCNVRLDAFALAVYPVTNAEYRCFVDTGGYEDTGLWTPTGRAWLAGELALDPETEAQYRQVHRALRSDVQVVVAQMRSRGLSISDEEAAVWRRWAAMEEDQYVETMAGVLVGEKRRQPVWWHDRRFNGHTQPVVGVNWYEAQAYAAWLRRASGKPYRLPNEAEWEWAAARGVRRYAWGEEWNASACNWSGSRLNAPAPLAVFVLGATPDGIEDLAGNIYEWTSSLFRPYPYITSDGREDPNAGGLRVVRGGSWYTSPREVRCADRAGSDPRYRLSDQGFRLARTLS